MTTETQSQKTAADVSALFRARNPLIWIVTREEARVEGYLYAAAVKAGYPNVLTWDFAAGVRRMDGSNADIGRDISEALGEIEARATNKRDRTIWILRDLPPLLVPGLGTQTIRQIRNLCRSLPATDRNGAQTMVIITPSAQVPEELAGHAIVIEWPMPDRDEIAALLDEAVKVLPDEVQETVRAD